MRRRCRILKTKNKALLAGPYPRLDRSLYRRFRSSWCSIMVSPGDDGSFTLENVKLAILAPPSYAQIPVAGPAPLSGKHGGLPCPVLSSGHDFKQINR